MIASLKSLAHSVYVTAIEQKGEEIRFTMYEKAKIDPSGIPKFLDSYKNDLIFRAEEPPYFLYCRKGRNKKSNTECTGYSETDFGRPKKADLNLRF